MLALNLFFFGALWCKSGATRASSIQFNLSGFFDFPLVAGLTVFPPVSGFHTA
jgi:hypothetical protein